MTINHSFACVILFTPLFLGNLKGHDNRIEWIYFQDPHFVSLVGTAGNPTFVRKLNNAVTRLGLGFRQVCCDAPCGGKRAMITWNLVGYGVDQRCFETVAGIGVQRRVLLLHEPVVRNLFNHAYPYMYRWFDVAMSVYDDLMDDHALSKFVPPDWGPMDFYEFWHKKLRTTKSFSGRTLCSSYLVGRTSLHPSELFSERTRIAAFMEEMAGDDFVWYGGPVRQKSEVGYIRWNGEIFWLSNLHPLGKCHGGIVKLREAADNCEKYKFFICYENVKRPGWISERIFQALFGGAVPIYWGAPNIEEYIPRGCYIDRRDFNSDEELLKFMRSFTEDDYRLHRRFVEDFYKSDSFLLFSPENFVDTVLSALFPNGYDRHKAFPHGRYEMVRRAKHRMFEMGLVTREKVAWALV